MISTYIDNPRVLRHLLALHDRISATIDVYNQQYGLALAPTTTPTESESAGSSDDDGGSSDDVEGRELPRAPISTELEHSLGDVVAAVGDLRASAPARYRDFLTVSQLAELAGSLDGYEWESDASAPSGDASTSSATAGADADAGADAGTDAGAGVSSTSTDLVAECLICDEEEAGRQLQGCGHFYCNDVRHLGECPPWRRDPMLTMARCLPVSARLARVQGQVRRGRVDPVSQSFV